MKRSTTKETIDAAALRLFSERGVSEVSIKELAVEARMSEGGLYRHFSSKEELAARVFAKAYNDIAVRMEEAIAQAEGFVAQTTAVVRIIYQAYDEDSVLLRFLLLRQHDALPRLPVTTYTPLTVVTQLLQAGQAEGVVASDIPLPHAAASFVGLVLEPLTFRVYQSISTPALESVDTTVRLIVRALAPLNKDMSDAS